MGSRRSSVRASPRFALLSAGLVVGLGLAATAVAGNSVGVLVLKEHGVGSAAQAQPFVDKLVAVTAKQNGWAEAKGQYQTKRDAADAWIQAEKPHYGILSLGAFLGMKGKYNLEPVGQVSVANAGGQQYFLISKSAGDLAGCKGKRLASDHADDAPFIEKVVSGGKFKLSDFTLVSTTRPLQTIKKVVGDEADCALIDDAQLAELPKIDGAAGIKQVWSSDKLPALVVVAFPEAPAAERKAFQGNLDKICQGEGAQACKEVGIQSLKSAGAADYAAVVTAYGK
jgi:hypothetical protein